MKSHFLLMFWFVVASLNSGISIGQDDPSSQLIESLRTVEAMKESGVSFAIANPNIPVPGESRLAFALSNSTSSAYRDMELTSEQKLKIKELSQEYSVASLSAKTVLKNEELKQELRSLGSQFENDIRDVLLPFQLKIIAAEKIKRDGYAELVINELDLSDESKTAIRLEAAKFATAARQAIEKLKAKSIANIDKHLSAAAKQRLVDKYGDELKSVQQRIPIQLIIDQYKKSGKQKQPSGRK